MRLSGHMSSACFIFMVCLLICCSPKQDDVESKLFSLEKVLTLDTENNQIAEMGLTDISYIDFDSKGKIFIANLKARENYIFILNKEGSLDSVFGSNGQGPGELQSPLELVISNQDEIFVTDRGKALALSLPLFLTIPWTNSKFYEIWNA